MLETIKEKMGMTDEGTTYECADCGATFTTSTDPDSPWLECRECESDRVEPVER